MSRWSPTSPLRKCASTFFGHSLWYAEHPKLQGAYIENRHPSPHELGAIPMSDTGPFDNHPAQVTSVEEMRSWLRDAARTGPSASAHFSGGVDPERHAARFYSLVVERDLFGAGGSGAPRGPDRDAWA